MSGREEILYGSSRQHGINLAVEENDKIKKEIQTAFENAENANYPRSEQGQMASIQNQ